MTMEEEKYCKTLPELAEEAAKSPYGGITHRAREMDGYLSLPDGRRYWLGKIEISIFGYGDGLLTNCDLDIKAEELQECER